jgi:putative transposase
MWNPIVDPRDPQKLAPFVRLTIVTLGRNAIRFRQFYAQRRFVEGFSPGPGESEFKCYHKEISVIGNWRIKMATRHKHTESEIAEKLHTAGEMAAQGKRHSAIAKSLGISIMTYHRWRKAHGTPIRPTTQLADIVERTDIPIERQQMSQIRELQLENSRLRRLVTDLLLEKVKLEERVSGSDLPRLMVGRN